MKFKLIFTGVLFLLSFCVNAQNANNETSASRAQSVYGEIFGNGVILSANYDVRFAKKQNGFGARAGIGFIPGLGSSGIARGTPGGVTFPLGINYLLGKRSSYLEAGLGVTFYTVSNGELLGILWEGSAEGEGGVAFVPSLGYRYQPIGNGLTARAFVSPFFDVGGVTFWAGLSLGYKF